VAIHVFAELGYPVKGLNFTITSDIPQQVGLASSTALEVAAAYALKGFFQAQVSEKELLERLTSSKAVFYENDVRPVDYLICMQAKKDSFLIVDEKKLDAKKIKSPLAKFKLVLVDSKVPRFGVDDELRQRREDIAKGLELLSNKKKKASLRDYAVADLVESLGNFPEEIRRRSMHIVREIHRIADVESALAQGDLVAFSKVIYHSHEDLRDLFEVSCPEIDWLVKRAQEQDGALASRMTGDGFGGCTYLFIKEEALDEYSKRMEDYERHFGFHPVIYEVHQAAGARVLPK
jgi:galactokinase